MSTPKRRRIQADDESEDEGNDQIPFQSPEQQQEEEDDPRYDSDDREKIDGDDDFDDPEDEGEGEDLIENMEADYQQISELDQYDSAMLDDKKYQGMTFDERKLAEEENARRAARASGLEELLADDGEEDDERKADRRGRFQRGQESEFADEDVEVDEESDIENDDELDLKALDQVQLREFLAQDKTRRIINKKFWKFLSTFVPDGGDGGDGDAGEDDNGRKRKKKSKTGKPVYNSRIFKMCAANLSSLEVSFIHLSEDEPQLAIFLADAPADMLELLDQVATKYTMKLFPEYGNIKDEIFVRITNLPISDSLRDLRQAHLNSLIKVSGVVTRRTGVQPQLKLAKYNCVRCGNTLGPFRVDNDKDFKPSACPNCSSYGPFKLNTAKTLYKNFQRVTLQEMPGNVPAGRVPRSKDVIMLNDLIDQARPGESVEITGVYTHCHDYGLTEKTGFPVFNTQIIANHVLKKEDLMSASALSEKDKQDIFELAKDPKIGERIINSIAPSIWGMTHAKRSIALSLFGGVPKNVSGHRIRSDINVLLLGDPGVAKSQLLKYAEKTAPRAVYSTGKGASAVGLTAAVRKDPITKEWTLEGGALVLADKGVCLIDEFDKMNEGDRTSIHEAMEQQSISVSKAGIITSLQARCSVIAAANPIGGRYDSSCTLAENVELTDPILQRFDCLVVLQDTVNPVQDEALAKFVTGSHMRSSPTDELTDIGRGDGVATRLQQEEEEGEKDLINDKNEVTIPQSLLRKYIQYARTSVHPQLKGFDQDKVASLYSDLRRESSIHGGVPIAVRHIESVMRMAEAHARMHLREYVREDDVDMAIRVMVESFIDSQKFSVRRALRKGFNKYLVSDNDKTHLLLHALNQLVKENQTYLQLKRQTVSEIRVFMDEFEQKAKEMNIFDVSTFYTSQEFKDASYSIDRETKAIWRPIAS
ncbi:hypothetical protein TrLO_g9969 [Triparma laevis f. longispina]|uniref:DNA replication licensing factor MCM2 n=1 Tax=Triparma laevis f. longispina TaxID=1714387 RepID=A0A9W6Z6Y5_9STRA|nr:hypothetical protein TrLO_g9969 [Triparma laevis f. longispina]